MTEKTALSAITIEKRVAHSLSHLRFLQKSAVKFRASKIKKLKSLNIAALISEVESVSFDFFN
jgi:cell fate (sporulation/competence/biofilm development) regulator YmcA (YheA/YmcA/DUF963 family)